MRGSTCGKYVIVRFTCFIFLLVFAFAVAAQPAYPSVANAHSHNDYEQELPFWQALRAGFGSVEADIFLDNDALIVAHDRKQVAKGLTLDSLYLRPLAACITRNKGFVYADTNRWLQLMIDIKTEAVPTLRKLVDIINGYPSLQQCRTLRIVISGNRPDPGSFGQWPAWVRFDAVFQKEYNAAELERIEMFSDNFARYSAWAGDGDVPPNDRQAIISLVEKAHLFKKKIRFWNAPDNWNAWTFFSSIGVDYINTDHINELSSFLVSRHKQ